MPKKTRKSSRKNPKVLTDDKGPFRWENFFVRGKQRRRKVRLTIIDGEVIEDLDQWLLNNAGDHDLHQLERWDLIEQRRMEQERKEAGPPRPVFLNIYRLEEALESVSGADYDDAPFFGFLDLNSGAIEWAAYGEETEHCLSDPEFLPLPEEIYEGLRWGGLSQFVYSLPKDERRQELERAIVGKGAFQRFKQIVIEGDDSELKHRWDWFEIFRKRERIEDWLRSYHLEPFWNCEIFEPPPATRSAFLSYLLGKYGVSSRLDS